ncbi:MAG: serine/threonine protein kinase [Persicimonas sp.]
MKVCPQCKKRFPDNASVCPHDGTQLRPAGASQSRPSPPRPNQPPPNKDDLVGRTFFGEYTITKKLGAGGMGAVYLARQNAIDQNVALKVLHARAAESNEIVQRFHREAKVISMLSHPNIVRVFIFGRTEDDLLYLVMEYVQGRELRHSLDQHGTLDELLAIKIMKQTCSALAEAHDLGIIHRDLKPDNILLTKFRGEQNFVKILDFGIAKLNEPEGGQPQQKLTQAGIVYGTPEYLSPEQAQAIDLDHRTDIYSLGCILYELMTGRVPFTDKNPVQILTKHVFEDPPKPSKVGPVAPTMEALIMKAIAKDPDDRFDDAMAMFEALVGREREILAERQLDTRDTYFPGSELTGMHQVSKLTEHLEEQKKQHASVQPAELQADGGSARGSSRDLSTASTMAMDTGKAQSVMQANRQPAQQPQHAQNMQMAGSAPKPAQSNDSNRKLIIIAIGAMVFILLVLLGLIAILMFTN